MKLKYIKECKNCGKDISDKGPKAEFCNYKCAKKYRRWNNLEEKVCPGCGKAFTGTKVQIYCTHACAISSKIYHHICEICKKEFTSKSPKSLICSPECMRKKHRVHKYYDRKCKICKKKFTTLFPSKLYCSTECKYKAKYLQMGCHLKKFKKKCKRCQKEFETRLRTAKFCSEECRWKFYHPDTTFTIKCDICHKEFTSKNPNAHFCSAKCRKRKEYLTHLTQYRARANKWREDHGLVEDRRTLMMQVVKRAEKNYHDTPGYSVKHNEFVESINIYRNNGQKCTCLSCNNSFILPPSSCKSLLRRHAIAGRSPCPFCGNPLRSRESQAESELSSLYPNLSERQYRPLTMKGMEIDLYDPKKKIGIEYNGLYWHSTKFKEDTNFHMDKADRAESIGINLIQIYETEWKNKNAAVRHILDSVMKKRMIVYPSERVTISVIDDMNIVYNFEEKNSVIPISTINFAIGLYSGNKLVAVCCFKKEKRNWAIVDYVSLVHTRVKAGLSMCISEFSRIHRDAKHISASADRRWGNYFSSMFEEAGFVKAYKYGPKFSFTDLKVNHKPFDTEQMNNLTYLNKEKKKTYYRIYDAGYFMYELKFK